MIECKSVWKRYTKSAQGIKSLLVGKKATAESRYARGWALQDINFSVAQGEAFGIVGHNGTGKSTLLSLLLNTIKPDQGVVNVNAPVAGLLELGAGFHPELSGRENIFLYGSILGMRLKELHQQFDKIVEFSELGEAIDNPIRTYSNGMVTRLGFSTIIHTPAEILLIDEVLAVGDSQFQNKCKEYLHTFKKQGGTLVLVSHDMAALTEMCDTGICLDMGKIVEQGEMSSVIRHHQELMCAQSNARLLEG